MYKQKAKEHLAASSPSRTHENRARSRSRSPQNDEERQEVRGVVGLTSQGRPPRVSRRIRSQYMDRSWTRAADQKRVGETGSKYRSTSKH